MFPKNFLDNRFVSCMALCGAVAVLWVSAGAWAEDAAPPAAALACDTCHTTVAPTHDSPAFRACSRPKPVEEAVNAVKEDAAPEVVVIGKMSDLYVPVMFPHRLHASMSGMANGCVTCHHHSPDNKPVRCDTCHGETNNPDNLRQVGLKGAYHRQCLSCHTDWDHEAGCIFCHAKRVPGQEPVVESDTAKVLGALHPNVKTQDLFTYPTNEYEKETKVYFNHKEHNEVFGKQCGDCHEKENCSRCHNKAEEQKRVKADPHDDCSKCHDTSDKCEKCHTKGEPEPFDHQKRTGVELKIYHKTVACAKCHTNPADFKGVKTECEACHAPDWNPKGFDHALVTKAFSEIHLDNDCSACHPKGMGQPVDCSGCHDEKIAYPAQTPFVEPEKPAEPSEAKPAAEKPEKAKSKKSKAK